MVNHKAVDKERVWAEVIHMCIHKQIAGNISTTVHLHSIHSTYCFYYFFYLIIYIYTLHATRALGRIEHEIHHQPQQLHPDV